MSKKQLIVAADVHAVAKAGGKLIHLNDVHAIVTAEARSLAKELGVELKQATDVDVAAPVCDAATGAQVDPDAVRRVIEAQTHGPASEAIMAEVLRRIALEGAQIACGPEAVTACPADAVPAQVHKITSLCPSPKTSASAVNMSQLDLTSLGLTSAAPCACGFMGWSNNQFAFNRTSDEINLVLEGELQFHVGQSVISAQAGDVMWIPKGTQGKIASPGSVRYFYLSFPG
ncbi:MAG: AraC family ligand binding domain-containing protein [Rhodoferax sp.]|jgi:ethanolamine utilization protein EutQ|uniref:AraC family ligand binding domain-containing protein n=1 Tax=Rhodoferax sp. TaxID=50421 RepID=UPI001B78C48C|nr:AraC family ligand binding domain-containing protein [Rhodoferax sp.]MBP9150070.1 AraC family ligand binding domain-containing protein [Rhodoferax sp.]MBP9734036.1 AraC family ligand binding domain-containing protein [Rhodoferax sp.]